MGRITIRFADTVGKYHGHTGGGDIAISQLRPRIMRTRVAAHITTDWEFKPRFSCSDTNTASSDSLTCSLAQREVVV
jgi:hypothetical protein